MPPASERRAGSERRRAGRGGRRPDDRSGFSPLVLVIGNGREPDMESEAILARLHFAVAPAADISEALRIAAAIQPDLVVAQPDTAARLRADGALGIPIIDCPEDRQGEALVDRIRETIRHQTG